MLYLATPPLITEVDFFGRHRRAAGPSPFPLGLADIARGAHTVGCALVTTRPNAPHSVLARVAVVTRRIPGRRETRACASKEPYPSPLSCTTQDRSAASNGLVAALAEGLTSSGYGKADLQVDLRCLEQAPLAVDPSLCASLVTPLSAMLAPPPKKKNELKKMPLKSASWSWTNLRAWQVGWRGCPCRSSAVAIGECRGGTAKDAVGLAIAAQN